MLASKDLTTRIKSRLTTATSENTTLSLSMTPLHRTRLDFPSLRILHRSTRTLQLKRFHNVGLLQTNPLPLFPFDCCLGAPRACSYLWFLVLLFQKNLPLTSEKGSFITPNMTDDGHDTDVTFAATWARGFLTPLLNNSYFMNNTLIVLTFDEDETSTGTSSRRTFDY
jgi:hypothetical protein